MRAVVTGAAGLLGENLLRSLLAQGWSVVGVHRSALPATALDALDVDWRACDVLDTDALTVAFRGADVVFHCAASVRQLRGTSDEIARDTVQGTVSVLEAVRRARALRLVHCSSALTVGLSEDGMPITEEHPWNLAQHRLDTAYVRAKRCAEEAVLSAHDVDAVVVNPALMIGPGGARLHGNALVQNVASGWVRGWPGGVANYVGVRDVAQAMVAAAERGRTGERYLLTGENLTWKSLLQRIASVAGVSPPSRPLPQWAIALASHVGQLTQGLGVLRAMPDPKIVPFMYHVGVAYTSEKARKQLGFMPAAIEEPVAETLRWLRIEPRLLGWDDAVPTHH